MFKKFLCGLMVAVSVISLIGCSSGNEEAVSSESIIKETTLPETTSETETETTMKKPKLTKEEKVQQIFDDADAAAETATEEDLNDAVKWFKNNIEYILNNNPKMEEALYYGRLLRVKNLDTGNTYEKIGIYALDTVKPVYLGDALKKDETTSENLSQLRNWLGLPSEKPSSTTTTSGSTYAQTPKMTRSDLLIAIKAIINSNFDDASVTYDEDTDCYYVTINQAGIAEGVYFIQQGINPKSDWTNVKTSMVSLCNSTQKSVKEAGYSSSVTYSILNNQNTSKQLLVICNGVVIYDVLE